MKLLYKIFTVLAITSLFFSCKKTNTNSDKLIVAMELQYPPFEMRDTNGDPAGVSVDIAKDLGKYLGREVVIENTAWTGLIPSLQTGKVDIIISSMTITEERAQVVDFSDPYIKAGLTLLIAKDSPVNSFADLNQKGIIVAVKSGTTGATIAQEQLPNAEIRLFDEVAASVLEVAQGKADVFIYDILTVYENYTRNNETTRINIQSIPGTDSFWGMAVKKGNKELLSEVNSFIKKEQESDEFNKIGDKFLGYIKPLFDESGIPFFFDI